GDWSSDVCSSDLAHGVVLARARRLHPDGPCRRGERYRRPHLALGCARLRRRYGGAHQRGRRGTRGRLRARQARRFRPGADGAAQPDDDHDRRLAPLVRLVRLQRRLGARGQRLGGPRLHEHLPRHRLRGALLDGRRVGREGQALDARRGLRRGRGPGRDHSGRRRRRLPGRRQAVAHAAQGGLPRVRVDRRGGLRGAAQREAPGGTAGRRGRGARGARYHLPRRARLRPLMCPSRARAPRAAHRAKAYLWRKGADCGYGVIARPARPAPGVTEFKGRPGRGRHTCAAEAPMSRLLPIIALILAGALTVARADVYPWTDEQGVTHYSDQWVPGSVLIKTVKPHPVTFDSSARSAEQKSLTAGNNRVSSELSDQANARAVQQDVAKAREVLCKNAKERYMRAIQSRRVFKEDKNGEREYLSDAAADAYREQARKDVQDRCGSVPEYA